MLLVLERLFKDCNGIRIRPAFVQKFVCHNRIDAITILGGELQLQDGAINFQSALIFTPQEQINICQRRIKLDPAGMARHQLFVDRGRGGVVAVKKMPTGVVGYNKMR